MYVYRLEFGTCNSSRDERLWAGWIRKSHYLELASSRFSKTLLQKMKTERGRHLTQAPGFHTHSHSHTWAHTYEKHTYTHTNKKEI